MPTLNWIGKAVVVKRHKGVPFRLLETVQSLSCGDADSGNLIVQGDNLLALKALLPRYAGQVKCIYIDPPHNTGNEGWVYNDNVNSAEIRRWLGEVVGKDDSAPIRRDSVGRRHVDVVAVGSVRLPVRFLDRFFCGQCLCAADFATARLIIQNGEGWLVESPR